MRSVKLTVLLSSFLLLAPTVSQATQDSFAGLFAPPPSWVQVSSPQRSMYVFQTNPDKEKSLFVTIRFINVPKQTAMEWAQDEARALAEKQGAKPLISPAEIKVGKNAFVNLRSQLAVPGKDYVSDQYFGQPVTGLVVEVAAVGSSAVLVSEKQNLNSLLSSFSF